MSGSPIRISSPQHIELEAMVSGPAAEKAVVICHPHPLYGGDMDNPVVGAIATAYRQHGWRTLRFNFRGVGASQGTYDDGRGEIEDLMAAIKWLEKAGCRRIDVTGYSFGAWIIARAGHRLAGRHRIVMVSPPVAFLEFQSVSTVAGLKLVIAGGRDEIAPAKAITTSMADWQADARLVVIEEADHFYGGQMQALTKAIGDFLMPL